jgi:hypothetical protein
LGSNKRRGAHFGSHVAEVERSERAGMLRGVGSPRSTTATLNQSHAELQPRCARRSLSFAAPYCLAAWPPSLCAKASSTTTWADEGSFARGLDQCLRRFGSRDFDHQPGGLGVRAGIAAFQGLHYQGDGLIRRG